MVFMKKAKQGAKPSPKVQGKKSFQKAAEVDMSDDDFDDDMDSEGDSEDEIVTKAPKGKQSLNERRVSFQVPGKNTPAKTPVGKKQATPAKDNSASKKQATPGKGGLQKFKGMEQQNQKGKKRPQPEDEEDDDEDDDDEDDSDFGGDMDLKLGGEDDDDDDDDDEDDDDDDEDEEGDDDDDDDDEDDDDEDEAPQKNSLKGKNQKQIVAQGKQTPLKGSEKQSVLTPKSSQGKQTMQSPKGQTPKKEIQTPKKEAVSPKANNAVFTKEEERRRKRDAMQLYVGNLPKETTAAELKALSSDIIFVSIPVRGHSTNSFAFLQFASEEKAEQNLKLLKNKTFKGAAINVDFVGYKSSHQSKNPPQINFKRLFISGLPLDVTIGEIATYFPKSHTISLNQSTSYRAATISFWTAEDGNAAFEENNELQIKGVKVAVLHSRKPVKQMKKKRRPQQNKKDNGHFSKKMKFAKKEDDSSDEE